MRLLLGFVAGFCAVLIFHQIGLGLLHLIGVTPGIPYDFKGVANLIWYYGIQVMA